MGETLEGIATVMFCLCVSLNVPMYTDSVSFKINITSLLGNVLIVNTQFDQAIAYIYRLSVNTWSWTKEQNT